MTVERKPFVLSWNYLLLAQEFGAKKKKLETAHAIARSTAINKARMEKVEARHQSMNTLQRTCESELKALTQDKQKYANLLTDLIVQGCLKVYFTTFFSKIWNIVKTPGAIKSDRSLRHVTCARKLLWSENNCHCMCGAPKKPRKKYNSCVKTRWPLSAEKKTRL